MLTIYLIIIIVPLFLVASMGLQRQPSVLAYTMSALALGSAVLFMWAALPWDVVSIYWRWVVPVLFLAALVFAWRRIGTAAKQASKLATIFGLVINGGLIVFFAGF